MHRRPNFRPFAIAGLLAGIVAAPASAEWYRAQRAPGSFLVYTLAGAARPAIAPAHAAVAAKTNPPMLAIECTSGEPRVVVYWREPMAGFYGQAVRYSIDGAAPRIEQWRLSTDQESMGHWGAAAATLARRLTGGRTLTVRATTRRGTAVEATFKLEKLAEAGALLARACKL